MGSAIDKRIFNNKKEECSNKCPYYKYDYRNESNYCKLYFEELEVTEDYSFDGKEINRCKECLFDVKPVPQREIIRLLREINNKIR